MKKVIVAAIAVLALSACAKTEVADPADAPDLPPSAGQSAEPASSKDAEIELNERGNLVKKIGEEAGLGFFDKPKEQVTFSLDKVEVDPPCGEFGTKPQSGVTLVLHFRVATGTNAEYAQNIAWVLNPFNFYEITEGGLTKQAQSGTCMDYADALPNNYGPNQQYRGAVEIVVPEGSGVLALNPQGGLDNGSGWEWHY